MAVTETIHIEGDASKFEKELKKAGKAINNVQDDVKEIKTGVKGIGETGKGAAKSLRGIGTAIKAAGIGLLLAAMSQLKEVFMSNQKVADAFNIAIETMKFLFNGLIENIIGPVTDGLGNMFTNPLESIKEFGSSIQKYVINHFQQMLEAIKGLGSAIGHFFKGEWAEAAEAARQAGRDVVDAFVGTEEGGLEKLKKFGNAVVETGKNIVKQTKAAVKSAKELVELEKAAALAAVERQRIQLEYQRDAEVLRQIRDDETRSIEERKKANDDLLRLLEEQAEKEREQINTQIALAQAEYEKNQTNENLVALKEAQLELTDLEERLEGQRSEALANNLSLERESLSIAQTKAETTQEVYEIERQATLDLLDDSVAKTQKEIEMAEEVANKKLELLRKNLEATEENTQARADAEAELAVFEAENAAQKLMLEKKLQDQKVATVKQAMSSIAQLVGEQTVAGKALALAQVAIDTYTGATKALAQGGVFGYVGAAGIIATGLANARQITAVDVPDATDTTTAPTITSPSAPAQFNVVGQTGLNQLVQAVGGQFDRPIRAYVTAGDINSGSELQRRRIRTATFG